MIELSPLCIPGLLGFLTLSLLLKSVPLRLKGLFLLGASLPTGLGITSLILFASFLLSPPHARILSFAGSLGLLLFMIANLIRFHIKNPSSCILFLGASPILPTGGKTGLINRILNLAAFLLFAYTAVTILQFYFLSVATNIFGGWDARYFWSLKAKFMFRSPEDWQLLFSSKLPWTNQNYPLLWPGTLVWGWEWLGRESLFWGPFASLTFYISSALLLVWYLAAHSAQATGWIAGSFFLILIPPLLWTLQQYADVPVTFFMTACVFTLITAIRSEQTQLLRISGLMGGLTAWTKNEGLIFLVWVYCALGVMGVLQKIKWSEMLKRLKVFGAGMLGPVIALFIVKYLARNAGTPEEIPHQSLANLSFLFTSGAERAGVIAKAFYDHMSSFGTWKGLWGFFLVAAVLAGFQKQEVKNPRSILFLLVLLINLGYFAILMITSPDLLTWQITTALDRLLIHSSFLAVAFVFEMLTPGERSSPSQ